MSISSPRSGNSAPVPAAASWSPAVSNSPAATSYSSQWPKSQGPTSYHSGDSFVLSSNSLASGGGQAASTEAFGLRGLISKIIQQTFYFLFVPPKS